jgi:hypothetical protein
MSAGSRRRVLATLAIVVLVGSYSEQAGAGSGAAEPYNPATDPNAVQGTPQIPPMNWQTIWGLVGEFEAQPAPPADRGRGAAPFSPYQPWPYTGPPSPGAPPQLVPGGLVYQSLYGLPAYTDWSGHSAWWERSPRIPWWSLIPGSRQGRDCLPGC